MYWYRHAAVAIGLLALFGSPRRDDASGPRVPPIARVAAPVRFELPNGLRVWVQEDHTRPVVLVQVTYKVGSINESPGTTGTAHYVEHMVYRATANIRNEDIYGYIDRIGGRYTGGTEQLVTSYGETVPIWSLEAALRVTAERMGRALFDSTEFERERNNVVTEANGFARMDPVNALRDAVLMTSFELHPYRYTSDSWAQDNLAIGRDVAYDFYRRLYGPNNAVLAIVGDVTAEAVRPLVEMHFAPLARAPQNGAVTIIEPPQKVEKRVTLTAPVDRTRLEVAYRAPQASHADYPVLIALDRVLSARLKRVLAPTGAELTTSQMATPYPFVYRLTVSAPAAADLERMLGTIQSEIASIGRDGITAEELAVAHTEPAGRGGRGRGAGGGGGGGGIPPRQSNLTQIADDLTARETFPWDVSAEMREKARVAAQSVSSDDLRRYVDRWLRTSQRTVGMLVAGPSDLRPEWSNGRPLAGTRLEIPPLTTPPAKRQRPDPVPARSLEPLAPLPIDRARRQLANGVVIRVAHNDASTTAIQARVRVGVAADPPGLEGLTALVARHVAADSAIAAFGVRLSSATIANDGYFDLRLDVPAARADDAGSALARALVSHTVTDAQVDAVRAAPAAGGGGRGNAINADARARVLGVVAPAWRQPDYGTHGSLARVRAADVSRFIARRFTGGAITVSVVGPDDTTALLAVAQGAFATLPPGRRVGDAAPPKMVERPPATPASEQRISLATETQVTVLAGLPGVPRGHRDRRALELLDYIVGVPSYGGRLGWALTKAGLTYSSAATTTSGELAGHILISTKCDTRNLDATVQAIREVITGVAERGVEDWEVAEAKAFTLGRTLLYGPRDDSGEEAIAAALLDSELAGEELLDLPAFSRAWLAVTPREIDDVARRYYRPDRLTVVAIGAVPAGPPTHIFPAGTFRALFEP